MKISRRKIDIVLARNKMTIPQLTESYGVSRARMFAILNSQSVTPATVGKLADALGCDVEDIIEEEG